MNKTLTDIVRRAYAWPEPALQELAQLAHEIEDELTTRSYCAAEDELTGIDRGLRDSAAGRYATDDQVEVVFAKAPALMQVVWTEVASHCVPTLSPSPPVGEGFAP